jgi:hypothetical protein
VLGNGSRRHSDLCCSAEFVSANRPQQEIAGSEWASPYQSSSSAEFGDELRLDLLTI